MSPSPALFKILDLVVTAMQATSGYGSPTSGAANVVYDGPLIGQDNPPNYVCVGWTPSGDTSGTLTTEPAVFGARADLLERGTFDVTVVASSGDEDASTVRATLRTMIADLEAAVYGLSDTTFAAYWCQVSSLDYRQIQSAAGLTNEATVTFDYTVQLGA
jgi:hypothetical protein